MSKLKAITKRALEIREKGGFKTEIIEKKRYNVAYIPTAIKQAAKELKKEVPAKVKRTTRKVTASKFKPRALTPKKWAEYEKAKKARPDAVILAKSGDFYVAYKRDAILIAKKLNLTLVGDVGTRMAGFPVYMADEHIKTLVKAGLIVGMLDELEPVETVRKKRDPSSWMSFVGSRKFDELSVSMKRKTESELISLRKNFEKVIDSKTMTGSRDKQRAREAIADIDVILEAHSKFNAFEKEKNKPAKAKRTTRKIVVSKIKERPKMEMAKPIKIGARKKGSRKLIVSKFVKVRQGDTFTDRYKIPAIKLYEALQLEKYKYSPQIALVAKMHFHKTIEKSEYPLFNSLFIKELAENGKSLTGKQRISIYDLYGAVFTGLKSKMPAKVKSGAYGLTEIIGNDDLRPAQGGVYFDDGFVYATDSFALVRINDVEKMGEKYDMHVVGIRKKDMNQIIDAKFPLVKSFFEYKAILLSKNLDIDELSLKLNAINLIGKSIDYQFVSKVGARIRLNFSVSGYGELSQTHDCKRLVDVLSVLRANGCKKVDIKVQSYKENSLFIIDGLNGCQGLVMPLLVHDKEMLSIFEPIKL
jgi:hypothetical protein